MLPERTPNDRRFIKNVYEYKTRTNIFFCILAIEFQKNRKIPEKPIYYHAKIIILHVKMERRLNINPLRF